MYKAMILMSDAIISLNIYDSPSNFYLLTSAEFSGLKFMGTIIYKASWLSPKIICKRFLCKVVSQLLPIF